MVKKNDETILALKKDIADKKAALKKIASFKPMTNCKLPIENGTFDLETAQKHTLTVLALKLHSYYKAAQEMSLEEPEFNGHKLSVWLQDVRSRLDCLNRQEKEEQLKQLEGKLTALLSVEQQTALAIEEIKAQL